MLLDLACTGLFPALLIRPKNRAADVAAGAITGLVAAITAFALSFGWFGVVLMTVDPIDEDLRLVSRAAWDEHAAERLLDRYPDLRDVPADCSRRGPARQAPRRPDRPHPTGDLAEHAVHPGSKRKHLRHRHDGGRPAGAAARAIRRAILPCLEIVLPCTLLVGLAFGVPFTLFLNRVTLEIWHAVLALFLVLALVAALRRSPWYVRLLFQAGWLFALVMLAVHRWGNPGQLSPGWCNQTVAQRSAKLAPAPLAPPRLPGWCGGSQPRRGVSRAPRPHPACRGGARGQEPEVLVTEPSPHPASRCGRGNSWSSRGLVTNARPTRRAGWART